MLLNLYKTFDEYNLPWLETANEGMYFSDSRMLKPVIDLMQRNINILSLFDDIEGNILNISLKNKIIVSLDNYSYTLTESDKMDFLSIIGNLVGLTTFSIEIIDGFVLDQGKLDINKFGKDGTISSVKSYEYAKFILARRLKFFGVSSIDNIFNSVVYVSQEDSSNVSAIIAANTMTFTITTSNIPRTQLFIEYIDQSGYNLWVKPTYGTIEFNYVSA